MSQKWVRNDVAEAEDATRRKLKGSEEPNGVSSDSTKD